ncbi:serine hydrolase domain-containing protein [Streptosporangium sp. NPDC000396]|uniref:serine hydrolase domain-containing protein n=1 Tax=Streptosporangium sp. NPDC000396 TaxID=3366185 RepID=UPI0036887D01
MRHTIFGRLAPRDGRALRRCAALPATVAAVLATSVAVFSAPPASASSASSASVSSVFASPATVSADGSEGRSRYGQAQLQRDVNAIRELGLIGVQARVTTSEDGRLYARSGVAQAGTRRPVPVDGYSRIASVTKSFVATVVLQLVAEEKLSLDDTVEKWLPGVVTGNGNDGSKITIRHLLQHTSGIHDDYPVFGSVEEYYQHRYDSYTSEQLVARSMRHKPDFEPGRGWGYSNNGYVLISMIIEKATGRAWHEEVDRRISRPLGLRRTVWSGTSHDVPRPHARGYLLLPPDQRVDVTKHFDGDAAGGLISTTADVDRFYRALLGGKLLPPEQLAQMRQTVRATGHEQAWPGARYGLGIGSRPLSCGGVYWHHGGDDYGYRTRTGVTSDGERSVVVSMSTQFADERSLRQEKAVGDLIDRALCGTR